MGRNQIAFPLRIAIVDGQARFGLKGSFVEKLQQHCILYDGEGDGQFYQLYSQPYGEGFFFEIVQRVNGYAGYAGYGAANAPYRTAALKRLLREMQSRTAEENRVKTA